LTNWRIRDAPMSSNRTAMADKPHIGETDIINQYFAPLAADTPGAFNLTDDAGLIQPPEGMDLVLTTDVVVSGVHFLDDAAPEDLAYKALGVNVSDLCAKGVDPAVYLLSIALPESCDTTWLEGVRQGLSEAQAAFGCTLLGGDTVKTPGPLTLSITAAGFTPEGQMVHRSGAREGDLVYVTGTIGDAALGLKLHQGTDQAPDELSENHAEFLRKRYRRPQPRLAAINMVRAHANAAMDVSDGLVGDFAKLCTASDVGGTLVAETVPLSDAAAAWIEQEPERLQTAITGGDDYEVLMSVSENASTALEKYSADAGLRITSIGRIVSSGTGIEVLDRDGKPLEFEQLSYAHF